MKRALITGSFDPITVGHLDIIERTSRIFDEVFVVAFINPQKSYRFDEKTRLELMRAATAHIENVRCDFSSGMVFEYVKENGIDCIVKGARNGTDFEYEAQMALFNLEKSGAETLILPASPALCDCSSTKVRSYLDRGMSVDELLPDEVARLIEEKN